MLGVLILGLLVVVIIFVHNVACSFCDVYDRLTGLQSRVEELEDAE